MTGPPSAPGDGPARPGDEPGTLRLLGRAAVADFRSASPVQILALVVVGLWLAFEWGPGNEIAVPTLLIGLQDRLNGAEALLIMPLAGFALGFGLQMFSGLVAAVGFSMLHHTSHAAWTVVRRWRPDSETKTFLSLGWPARWGVSFFIGTTAVVLIQLFTTGQARATAHTRAIVTSATLVAGTIGAMAFAVALAVVLGRRYPAAEPYVDDAVDLLANPLFWIILLASVLVLGQLSARLRSDQTP